MRVAVASSVGYGSITPSRLLFPAVRPGSAKAVFGPLRRLRLAGARPAAPGEAFRSSVGSPGNPVEAVAESRAANTPDGNLRSDAEVRFAESSPLYGSRGSHDPGQIW